MVAKWDYCEGKVLDKVSIHYNIGHLMTMEGDTVSPDGKYLVALNKLAIDRFNPVGPLHPQNHQLIDISGDKMELLYDMPLPLGEPHYARGRHQGRQAEAGPCVTSRLEQLTRTRSGSSSTAPVARRPSVTGRRQLVDRGLGTTIRSHITPEIIEAQEGTMKSRST